MIYYNKGIGEIKETKVSKLQNKIIRIITRDTTKEIKQVYKDNYLMDIETQYKYQWIKLIHTSIHNCKILPTYYQYIYQIQQNRNGLQMKTIFRKKKIGERYSVNITTNLWNKINKETREIADRNLFIDNIIKQLMSE